MVENLLERFLIFDINSLKPSIHTLFPTVIQRARNGYKISSRSRSRSRVHSKDQRIPKRQLFAPGPVAVIL